MSKKDPKRRKCRAKGCDKYFYGDDILCEFHWRRVRKGMRRKLRQANLLLKQGHPEATTLLGIVKDEIVRQAEQEYLFGDLCS